MKPRFVRAAAPALLLLLTACATGRPGAIASSRLGMAKSPGVLPAGVLQLEAGSSAARLDQRKRYAYGETLLRLGVGRGTELRAGIPSYLRTVTPDATTEGMGDAFLAVRHRLTSARGWAPTLAVTAGTALPTGEDGIGAGAAQPEIALGAEWMLPERFKVIAMGVHRDAAAPTGRYGLNTAALGLRRDLVPGLTAQADYGIVSSTRAGARDTHHARLGAALRLSPDLQLDAWAGQATSAGNHETLLGIGFARRW